MNTTLTTDIMCTMLRATALAKYSERDARKNDAHQNTAQEQVETAMWEYKLSNHGREGGEAERMAFPRF